MYGSYIGNKNYSSWSLRPWVLLRANAVPFTEHMRPFSRGSNFDAFRSFFALGQGALPARWRHGGVGLARHQRVPGRTPPRDVAGRGRRAHLGALRGR